MAINANKPKLWKADVAASVDLYNDWFIKFAPKTYRETRARTTETIKQAFKDLDNLQTVTAEDLKRYPGVLQTLRMATAPPIARDRLSGLAAVGKHLVKTMEEKGRLPSKMAPHQVTSQLQSIARVLQRLLDRDIFPWLERKEDPTPPDLYRASTIVADRLTGAVADPIVRNAQEREQLAKIGEFLKAKGYRQVPPANAMPLTVMAPGTFTFRLNVPVGRPPSRVNIPIDAVIQPKKARANRPPIFIEAKSAGDFTNTNKRRKEEAQKIHQLRATYGKQTQLILFLRGYFDTGYLGYEAAEGLDWIWEHRMSDMLKLGI